MIFIGLFTVSTVLTFLKPAPNLLSILSFPPVEMNILKALPVQGYHLAILAGLPLILTWVMIIMSKRYFISETADEFNQKS